MHALAFGANLQPRFATLRIFIRWRVQSCLPRETALVYIAILPASARKRALMLNRKRCETTAADNEHAPVPQHPPKILRLQWGVSFPGLVRFLSNYVNVDGWGMAEEPIYGIHVEEFSPSFDS